MHSLLDDPPLPILKANGLALLGAGTNNHHHHHHHLLQNNHHHHHSQTLLPPHQNHLSSINPNNDRSSPSIFSFDTLVKSNNLKNSQYMMKLCNQQLAAPPGDEPDDEHHHNGHDQPVAGNKASSTQPLLAPTVSATIQS